MAGSGVLLCSLGNGVIISTAGVPQNGHSIYVYSTGTTNQVQVYSDLACSIPLAQPLITGQAPYVAGQIPGYIPGEQAVDFYDSYANVRMQANPVASADLVPSTGSVVNAQGATSGYVPVANGSNGYAWAAQSGGSGGLTEAAVQSSSFSASASTFYPVDLSTANVTATLPNAPADKTQVECKVVKVNATAGTYALSIATSGSDVFNVSGGPTSLSAKALHTSSWLQYAHATGVWYEIATDAALGQPLGAAKLGSDGTVGGPSGSALTSSVVTVSSGTPTANQIPVFTGVGNAVTPGAAPYAEGISLAQYCALDAKFLNDGAITATTVVFMSATAAFTTGSVGKTISVAGAGAAGAGLTTTIASYVNATTVHLTATAGTTVSAAEFVYGTDDTTNAQAAIAAVEAISGELYFPAARCLISGALSITSAMTLRGVGSFDHGPTGEVNFGAVLFPYVSGSVFVQVTAATDAIDITALDQTVDLAKFGVMFAPGIRFTNTGHGINCTATTSSYGIASSRWDDVCVWGHDGNHYAYILTNAYYSTIANIRGYGGGGLNLISSAYQTGNSTFIEPYFQVMCNGTSHGIELHCNVGCGLILNAWLRPQTIFQVLPANFGTQTPSGSQLCLADTGAVSSATQCWYAPDFEFGGGSGGGAPVFPTNATGQQVFGQGTGVNSRVPQWGVQQLVDFNYNKGYIDSTVFDVTWQARNEAGNNAQPTFQVAAISTQTADIFDAIDLYGVERTGILPDGTAIFDAPAVDPVWKDAINGHYYRLQIQNGTLALVNLGTTRPTGQIASPASIDGLVAWYEARLIASPPSSGTAISAWADSSLFGNNLAQATGGDQPLYETGGPNGEPFIRFNGSSDYMATGALNGFSAAPGSTVFIVYRRNASTANAGIVAFDAGSGNDYNSSNGWLLYAGSGALWATYRNGATTNLADAGSATWQVGEAYFTASLQATTVEINGAGAVSVNSSGQSLWTPTQLVVAARYTSGAIASPYSQIDVAAICVYQKQLTTTERSAVRQWLGAEYGVTVTP